MAKSDRLLAMKTSNLPDSDAMSADERVAEVVTVLVRRCLTHIEGSGQTIRDSAVHLGFSGRPRVHTIPYPQELQ